MGSKASFAGLLTFSFLLSPAFLKAQVVPVAGQSTSLPSSPPAQGISTYAPDNTITTTPSYFGGSGPTTTSSLGTPNFAGTAQDALTGFLENPLRWGPFTAHPHVNYVFLYATGVLVTPGREDNTALHTVAPGITIESPHLAVDYTPTLNYYSKGPYDDVVNHNASLRSLFGYGDWNFSIEHVFLKTSNPTIETGTQTTVSTHLTGLEASWNYSEKVFFNFTLSQQIQDAENFQSYRQWGTMEWINYRLTQQLSIGGGVGGGYADVDVGSNMTYEQFQGRINWRPSKKLSLNLNGGVEVRQFIDVPDSDNLLNPLVGASVVYRLFDYTVLSLYANRSVSSSLFENQIVETATVGGGVNQRLLKYLNLNLSAGYRKSDYKFTFLAFNQQFAIAREEEYKFISTSLGTTFLKKGNVSVGYQHGINDSSLAGYSFESDQFSFQVGYRF